jgi:hypothetical protein
MQTPVLPQKKKKACLSKFFMRFHLENIQQKKGASRVAQVIDSLPGKCEVLNLNPSTTKKRKKGTFCLRIGTELSEGYSPVHIFVC